MRLSILFASAVSVTLVAAVSAQACTPAFGGCRRPLVVFPVDTPEGYRIGTLVAPVRRPVHLERSRITGQPMPVVFNNPGRVPGSVDPELVLMPLPRVGPARTHAVYPKGY